MKQEKYLMLASIMETLFLTKKLTLQAIANELGLTKQAVQQSMQRTNLMNDFYEYKSILKDSKEKKPSFYERNKERYKAYAKDYNKKNKEKILEYQKKRREISKKDLVKKHDSLENLYKRLNLLKRKYSKNEVTEEQFLYAWNEINDSIDYLESKEGNKENDFFK